jgi:1-acylglycerone phosphate reductase
LYNSSKAALNSIGDNLRVELAPFDVKVITVVTGAVITKFFDNKAPSSLPAGTVSLLPFTILKRPSQNPLTR